MIIHKLITQSHPVLKDFEITLSNGKPNNNNYFSVIIGPNGTGKSNVLGTIAEIICNEMSSKKKTHLKKKTFKYHLSINNIEIIDDHLSRHDNIPVERILAITSATYDKFPFINARSWKFTDRYFYLGQKTATNNIFLSKAKTQFTKDILKIASSKNTCDTIVSVLECMRLGSKVTIRLSKGSDPLGLNSINSNPELHALIDGSQKEESLPNKEFNKQRYKENKLAKLINTNTNLAISILNTIKNESEYILKFDFANENSIKDIYKSFDTILELLEAKAIESHTVSIHDEFEIDINSHSSGARNILKIMTSIVANIKDSSLLLLDEPEVSLHPNWQIIFMDALRASLQHVKKCHCIVATHSNFIISNIDPIDSSIVSLETSKQDFGIIARTLDVNSYGWSPELVLYEIFGLTGFRNRYFESDIQTLITALSNGESVNVNNNMLSSLKRLKKFNITENDPLFEIVTSAERLANLKIGKKNG